MRKQSICKIAWAFSMILTLGTCLTFAQQPTTVTLSTTATDPVRGPFSVTAQFGAPVTTFTASHLALGNAKVSGIKPGIVQNSIIAGINFNLALKNDITVVAWGDNEAGQCNVPAGLTGVVAISAGDFSGLALKADGTISAWGCQVDGQPSKLPGVPPGLTNVRAISSGNSHNLALKTDGTVVAWGPNYYGGCDVPAGLTGVVAVSAGNYHSLALKADGTVVAWGYNGDGQCVVPSTDVVAVSGAHYYSLGLKADGTVVVWGYLSTLSQYGLQKVPAGLTGVVSISAGDYHSLALKADGTVVAWGTNDHGQCNVPAGLTGVVAISAGQYHSLALKADGTLVAWGDNSKGQCNIPAGLKVCMPGLIHHTFDVTPLDYGPLTVQVPAGVIKTLGGVSNAASNILQFNSLVPVTLSRFMAE